MPSIENTQLSETEQLRYSRHIKLDGFGLPAQLKLKAAKVLIVGAGGLGNPVGLYLAGAGVGTIGVADFDKVSLSNLHRQVAFKTKDIGLSKCDSLIDAMTRINPDLRYVAHNFQIEAGNVEKLIQGYDLVIDGSDNFATRFLIADACYFQKIALLHGAVHQFQAQIALFNSDSACFRCLYREPPGTSALPACNEAGILNVVTGVSGLIMATEAVKYLAGLPCPALGAVLVYDALLQSIQHLSLSKDHDCPLCGHQASIAKVRSSIINCAADAGEISIEEAKRLIANGAMLLDVREDAEFASGHIENAVSLPLSTLESDSVVTLPQNETIVTYCKSGIRSLRAVSKLRASGYQKSYSIAGGILAWNAVK